MRITLKDIAEAAGVKPSTASLVLNGKQRAVRISEQTCNRVRQAARRLNYHPNAAAQALATHRTGRLGFILSDDVTDGWTNIYYGRYLAGVEETCRELGYGLSVSRYNVTNLDSFVFPRQVAQRDMDGLIVTGYVEHAVLDRFREFGIPCVCLGEDMEYPDEIPAVTADTVSGTSDLIWHAIEMGHRRIGLCMGNTPDARAKLYETVGRVNDSRANDWKPVVMEPPGVPFDYSMGRPLFDQWRAMPAAQRPTLIIANDQVCLGFLQALGRAGMTCPRDVSLISGCDTRLCEFSNPGLTSLWMDMKLLGATAVRMLVEHLDHGAALSVPPDGFVKCSLVKRGSVAQLPASFI